MQHGLARGGLADGVGEFVRADLLEDVREGARPYRGEDVLVIVVGGEHDDVRARRARDEAPRRLHAVHSRHNEVHQGDVGGVLGGELDSFLPAPGLGYHADIALCLQKGADPLSHQRMIVYQQYGDRLAHNHSPFFSCTGQTHSTRVPLPGARSTSTCPPSLTSRSRMLWRPKPPPGFREVSKPRPSSATRRVVVPAV